MSPRKAAILERLAVGLTLKEIARDLGVAEATVKSHVAQIGYLVGVTRQTPLVAHWLLSSDCTDDQRWAIRWLLIAAGAQSL